MLTGLVRNHSSEFQSEVIVSILVSLHVVTLLRKELCTDKVIVAVLLNVLINVLALHVQKRVYTQTRQLSNLTIVSILGK